MRALDKTKFAIALTKSGGVSLAAAWPTEH